MRSRRRDVQVIAVAAGLTLLAACWAPDSPCSDGDCELTVSAADQLGTCESFGCGGNARISGFVLHELNSKMPGAPNEQGFVITHFRSGSGATHRLPVGTPMLLDVQGDELLGLVAGQPAIEGEELVGATIDLARQSSASSVSVQIQGTSETEFWVAESGGPARARLYRFTTTVPGRGPGSICDYLPNPRGAIDVEPTELAVVFAGDRYNAMKVAVDVPGEPRWFNIACVGTALAKMHLLRHTSSGSGSVTSPTKDQRQAMLKLLSGDYCGDGRAYARNGTPLFFQDPDRRYTPPSEEYRLGEVEAIWTAAGALCLDRPRSMGDSWRSYAEVRAQIVSACEDSPVGSLRRTIPRCTTDQLASWWDFGPITRNVDPP